MGHVQEEWENAGNAQTMRSTCGRLCRPIVISCSSSGILRLWLGKLPEWQGHARGHPLVDQGRRGAGPRSLIPLSRACPPAAAASRSWDLRRGVAFERQNLSAAAAPGRHDASAAAAFGRCNGPTAVEQERGPPRDRGDRG